MQQPSNHQIQPIDSLTPFLGGKWWIRARVTDKGDIRTWNKPQSQGKLFAFTLIDESAAIRATVFNDAVDTFEPLLVDGQVYYFSGGQVKNANRKFNNVNNDYELTFDRSSEIMLARGDAMAASLPAQRYNFVPIELLKQRETGSLVDVLAVVLNVEEVSAITQKSTGKELIKRNIKLGDATAAVELTTWNDEARNWSYPVGTVVALRELKIGSFDGVNLSSTFQTKIEVNPAAIANDVRKLSDWYVATGGTGVASLSNQGRGSGIGSTNNESYRGRKYIQELSADGLGRGMKADFVDIRCVPIYVKQDNLWYEACPNCNKKVTPDGAQADKYRCEKCDTHVHPNQRYLISAQVSDNVDQIWVTLFNEAGVEFFGMAASELKSRLEEDPNYLTMLTRSRMNRPVLMRLRVKEEQAMNNNNNDGNEGGGERLRLTVMHLTEFMPLTNVTEENRRQLAANLKMECEDMIRCIESY